MDSTQFNLVTNRSPLPKLQSSLGIDTSSACPRFLPHHNPGGQRLWALIMRLLLISELMSPLIDCCSDCSRLLAHHSPGRQILLGSLVLLFRKLLLLIRPGSPKVRLFSHRRPAGHSTLSRVSRSAMYAIFLRVTGSSSERARFFPHHKPGGHCFVMALPPTSFPGPFRVSLPHVRTISRLPIMPLGASSEASSGAWLSWPSVAATHLMKTRVRKHPNTVAVLAACILTWSQKANTLPFHSQEGSISNSPCSLTRKITLHTIKNLGYS